MPLNHARSSSISSWAATCWITSSNTITDWYRETADTTDKKQWETFDNTSHDTRIRTFDTHLIPLYPIGWHVFFITNNFENIMITAARLWHHNEFYNEFDHILNNQSTSKLRETFNTITVCRAQRRTNRKQTARTNSGRGKNTKPIMVIYFP